MNLLQLKLADIFVLISGCGSFLITAIDQKKMKLAF
jgi:hypothetical protein